jgi:hypothetical protein
MPLLFVEARWSGFARSTGHMKNPVALSEEEVSDLVSTRL